MATASLRCSVLTCACHCLLFASTAHQPPTHHRSASCLQAAAPAAAAAEPAGAEPAAPAALPPAAAAPAAAPAAVPPTLPNGLGHAAPGSPNPDASVARVASLSNWIPPTGGNSPSPRSRPPAIAEGAEAP